MLSLVAVNGPTVAGVDGTSRVTPDDGTGFGIGMSKAIAPVEIDEGVAPVASIVVVSVPVSEVRPVASASCTIGGGKLLLDLEAGHVELLTRGRGRRGERRRSRRRR